MKYQPVKLALPKGRFLSSIAKLLDEVGLDFANYHEKTRQYSLNSTNFPHLSAKVFQEKDIPIQVAVGNYDLGICGLDWIEELQARYPASALVKIANLDYGKGSIYVAAGNQLGISRLDGLPGQDAYRIVSEYPNIAEALALNLRMREFKIFPVWGDAEIYPPENADLAILWQSDKSNLEAEGLISLAELFPVTAYLIACRKSLENKDLSQILARLRSRFTRYDTVVETREFSKHSQHILKVVSTDWQAKKIKLALPDGHQHRPTSQFLKQAGFHFQGYSEKLTNRRPIADLHWLGVKVIRPQDMPLQVANGNFDLAITGKDWLLEHLCRFPSSPVEELLNLDFGKVKIVVAVSQGMPVNDIDELRSLVQTGTLTPIRVASEYTNIADKYLRDNHINPYKLIPTWGASEAFLPDDADLLIDNTQTGKTLAQQQLKIIDVLFQSSACLIGNKTNIGLPGKKEKVESLIQAFQEAKSQ
ncbi:MAG: ATP phosphoribosyltransferase [Chloroflexota bacterium]|nr:ATP phosphoribosyltransferase [Chloroflexota bacterium]